MFVFFSHKKTQNRTTFVVGLFLLILIFSSFFIFTTHKDEIGVAVWNIFHSAPLSLKLHPEAEFAVAIGNYYFNVNGDGKYDLENAEKYFIRALTLDSNVSDAHYQLARIHFINGLFSRALFEINEEIKLHPDNGRAYYVRGLIHGYRGSNRDLERAENDFKSFVTWDPTEWAGYNDLAWIQIKNSKFNEARDTILLAFELLPQEKERNVWLWTSLGTAHLNMREYNKAKENFLLSQEISKGFTAEYFWSAYPGNNKQNANEAFKQFLASLHFNLGIVYEKLGETINSIESYEAYLSLLPQGPFPQKNEVQEKILTLEAQL